jgi:hypothetical protein
MKNIKCFSSTRIPFSSEPCGVKHREYYRILINEPLFFLSARSFMATTSIVGWFKSNRNRFRPILPKPFMAILVFNVLFNRLLV